MCEYMFMHSHGAIFCMEIRKSEISLLLVVSRVWNELQTSNLYQYESLGLQKLSEYRRCCICIVSILVGNRYYNSARRGQVDLAETDENGNENERGNENGNENENGKGRQDSTFCGIGRRSCK